MNITIFGATGQVGKRIVQMALNQGHHVTAFGRNVESLIDRDNTNELLTAQKGYLFNEKDVAKAIENECNTFFKQRVFHFFFIVQTQHIAFFIF